MRFVLTWTSKVSGASFPTPEQPQFPCTPHPVKGSGRRKTLPCPPTSCQPLDLHALPSLSGGSVRSRPEHGDLFPRNFLERTPWGDQRFSIRKARLERPGNLKESLPRGFLALLESLRGAEPQVQACPSCQSKQGLLSLTLCLPGLLLATIVCMHTCMHMFVFVILRSPFTTTYEVAGPAALRITWQS